MGDPQIPAPHDPSPSLGTLCWPGYWIWGEGIFLHPGSVGVTSPLPGQPPAALQGQGRPQERGPQAAGGSAGRSGRSGVGPRSAGSPPPPPLRSSASTRVTALGAGSPCSPGPPSAAIPHRQPLGRSQDPRDRYTETAYCFYHGPQIPGCPLQSLFLGLSPCPSSICLDPSWLIHGSTTFLFSFRPCWAGLWSICLSSPPSNA